jgi:hypothetical protein
LTPENAYEAWLAPSLRLCAASAPPVNGIPQYSLQVINAGPGIWVIDGFPPWNADALNTPDPTLRFFRAASSGTSGLAVEPGQSARATEPDTFAVEIHLDAGLQAEWEVTDRSVQAIEDKIRSTIIDSVGPTARAVVACAQAADDVLQSPSELQNASATDVLQRIYQDAASVDGCRSAIDEATQDAEAKREPAPITTDDLTISALGEHEAGQADLVIDREGSSLISALEDASKIVEHVHI